ncbi:MAG: cobyrinate a,c-diamide synthase [Bradyrhizobium sp.]|jgi:cobyrinic acid a,c-diamide synthase|uniref:cobyrinate a,c-diamide synthase n=1 Tax=Bradyrhizobium sp. TaxID=376 RepID=UPI003C7E60B9
MTIAAAPKGLIIAAPRSGAGKTTVTLGVMRALVRRGTRVAPFKCGPDYIDLAFHAAAAKRASTNLDGWAMSAPQLLRLVHETTAETDLAIVEGVMGLFDGAAAPGRSGRGSAADLAALLSWPVILVIDVSGQTETAAAVALGCARYRDDVRLAGVILNRVARERHRSMIEPAFDRIGIKVLGALPRDDSLVLPERHLGLVQAQETADIEARLERLADKIASTTDLGAIAALAQPIASGRHADDADDIGIQPPGQRIAIASDAAFSFTYPHLVQHWRARGAEIVPFSPLADEAPDALADAIWLPGGYPELHGARLSAARRFIGGLRNAATRGVRIHGECGGYMVLGQGIEDAGGHRHEMAGLFSLETSFAKRRLHLGYRRARLLADCGLGLRGAVVHGHEFHYASIVSEGDEPLIDCHDALGVSIAARGARRGTVSGSFLHVIAGDAL